MKTLFLKVVAALVISAFASSCGFVGQQLADKASEERLLKPGALDASLTGYHDTYKVNLLDKYRITHDWITNSNGCGYSKLPGQGRTAERYKGETYIVLDIYEDGNVTKQRDAGTANFDKYVRSKKIMAPIWETVNGVRQKVGEKEIENGWTPVCFYAWTGGQRYISLDLFKSSLADRIKVAERKSGTNSNSQ